MTSGFNQEAQFQAEMRLREQILGAIRDLRFPPQVVGGN